MLPALLLLLLLQLGTAPVPVPTVDDDQVALQAHAYVSSIDTPISAARWQALGPRGAAVLEQMAQDHTLLPSRRARAVDGLAFAGTATSHVAVEKLARAPGEPVSVRLSAVRTLGSLLGDTELASVSRPLLEGDADLRIRAAVADVLAAHGGCRLVVAQHQKEKPLGQLAFRKASKRCAAP